MAEAYGLNRHTVAKWRQREETADASHRPHRLHVTLSAAQEAVVEALRFEDPEPVTDSTTSSNAALILASRPWVVRNGSRFLAPRQRPVRAWIEYGKNRPIVPQCH